MFNDLKWLLEIRGGELPNGFSLLSDDGVDGKFLIYFYLTLFLDGPGHVCLVATSSTFARLSTVAQKLGFDLASYVAKEKLVVVDCFSQLLDGVFSCSAAAQPNVHSSFVLDESVGDAQLRPVYETVCSVIDGKPGAKWCVLVEDASQLLNAGVRANAILNLLHYCRVRTQQSGHLLAALVHAESVLNDSVDDDDAAMLVNTLLHWCDVHIGVSSLKSGLHQHIHGHLRIEWPVQNGVAKKPPVERHFKVLDRTVTVFAKGTSSAVL